MILLIVGLLIDKGRQTMLEKIQIIVVIAGIALLICSFYYAMVTRKRRKMAKKILKEILK